MRVFNQQNRLAVLLGLTTLTLVSFEAKAVPSFSRQTGMACTSCHTQAFGPGLNPMGRDFKLKGYTMSNAGKDINSKLPPISGMVVGSFTNTNKNDPDLRNATDERGRPLHLSGNNNGTFDQASLFYAGKVWSKIGAFMQLTFDGVNNQLMMDNADIRAADQIDIGDYEVTYGVSLNNSPTVQDLWNTTPVWSFPYSSSPIARVPGAAPMMEGGLGQRVGGGTAYAMINNLLYLEAGAYASFSQGMQRGMGIMNSTAQPLIDGGAPYWRVALQHEKAGHYFSLGTFGMQANVFPERDKSFGRDTITDLGVDANYQYLANPEHIFEFKTSYIREDQKNRSSQNLGLTENNKNHLNSFRTNASYTWNQTVTLGFGYNKLTGSVDPLLYAANTAARPNSEYFTTELAYVPFGKTAGGYSSWTNLRFALQYTGYTKFNGSSNNYDGTFRDAGHNNTLLLNGWLMF